MWTSSLFGKINIEFLKFMVRPLGQGGRGGGGGGPRPPFWGKGGGGGHF